MFGLGKQRPTAKDAAIRAYMLKFVAASAMARPPEDLFREMTSAWPSDEHAAFARDVSASNRARLEALGPWKARLTPRERRFAEAAFQDVTSEQHAAASWRLEAFRTLLWALGLVDPFPPYDDQADADLLNTFPPGGEIDAFIRHARLRPAAEIEQQREAAELWRWRSRTRSLIEAGEPVTSPGFDSYDQIVRMVAKGIPVAGAAAFGGITDQDLTAFGAAYRAMTDDQWSIVRGITAERHHTLNWLCGYAPGNRWDDTPTDT